MLLVNRQGKHRQTEDGEEKRKKAQLWNKRIQGRMHPRVQEKDIVHKVVDEDPHGDDQ